MSPLRLIYLSAYVFPVVSGLFTQGELLLVPLLWTCVKIFPLLPPLPMIYIFNDVGEFENFPIGVSGVVNFLSFWKKNTPTLLLACSYDRYDASLCMPNFISLEWNLNLESGFVAQKSSKCATAFCCLLSLVVVPLLMFLTLPAWWGQLLLHNREIFLPPFVYIFCLQMVV